MKHLLCADLHLKSKHRFTRIVEGKLWDRMCQEKLNTLFRIPIIAEKYKVDIIEIAGDVFDTSNPPEVLKAEFCKILNLFKKPVIVITGRPGDHDFVSENNYVMMDLKEAYGNYNDNIIIAGKNTYEHEQIPGVLIAHVMLAGISELYDKHSVKLTDEMFKKYKTILLGDYHAFYHKKFGDKDFIYPGSPYPTRYGETNHSVALVETDDTTGTLIKVQILKLATYQLNEVYDINYSISDINIPQVIKYKIHVKQEVMSNTISTLEQMKREYSEQYPNLMDLIWEIAVDDSDNPLIVGSAEDTLFDVCTNYIAGHIEESRAETMTKLFTKFYKECI
jgi:DNA repair exonuclease SbcCD nuclease subunit